MVWITFYFYFEGNTYISGVFTSFFRTSPIHSFVAFEWWTRILSYCSWCIITVHSPTKFCYLIQILANLPNLNTCKSFRSITSCLNIKGCKFFTTNIFISVEPWFENLQLCAVKCTNCAWKCKLILPIIFGSLKVCRIYRKLDPGVCFSNNCLHYGSKCSREGALMDSYILSHTSLETRVTNCMPQKHFHSLLIA